MKDEVECNPLQYSFVAPVKDSIRAVPLPSHTLSIVVLVLSERKLLEPCYAKQVSAAPEHPRRVFTLPLGGYPHGAKVPLQLL